MDDDTNKPIADCIVVASLAPRGSSRVPFAGGTMMAGTWITTRTDEKGNYRFSLPANANYNIWTYKTEKMAPAITIATGSLKQKLEAIRLQETIDVTGQLIDAETNDPITNGMRVSWHGPARPKSGGPVRIEKSNEDGTFTLKMVPGMNYPYIGFDDGEFSYQAKEVFDNDVPTGKNGFMLSKGDKTVLKILVEKKEPIPRLGF